MAVSKWLKSDKSLPSMSFNFLACSGATTTDLWDGSPAVADHLPGSGNSNSDGVDNYGEGPQFGHTSALSNARIITLSIGGNDLSFATVMETCVAAPIDCGSVSTSSSVADLESNITNLEPVLVATYQQIEQEAPNAAIYVMGYPDEVPPQPSLAEQTFGCGPFLAVGGGPAISYLATAENNLNTVISEAATTARIYYVNPNTSSGSKSFVKHTWCSKDRWFNGHFHPSTIGQANLAKLFQAAIAKDSATTGSQLLTGVRSVVSDSADTGYCDLLATGGIGCWGDNSWGELGNGTTTTTTGCDCIDAPVTVSGITDATSIASTGNDTGTGYCALLTTGGIDCWGYNAFGELGNGTTGIDSDVPVPVTGITDANSITTDGAGDCALLTTGGIDCWGYNSSGQLGDGTTTGP